MAAAEGWRLALAALDLDGDGAQELIIASGKTVSAWTWNGATRACRARALRHDVNYRLSRLRHSW